VKLAPDRDEADVVVAAAERVFDVH